MAGWIKDYRKEIESDIWLMPPMYHRVWQWIKYSANHSEGKIPNKDGTFTIIKAGQRATSYRQIAKGVGYYEGRKWKEPNSKTVKSIIDWLVKQKMISVYGNTLGTIITIENWASYQEKEIEGNTKRITTPTRGKHHLDTNNNDKEELKNEKKEQKNICLYDYWQEKAPHKHNKISESISKELNKIKANEVDEVKIAIDRYVIAYNDKSYFYNQAWVLNNFLKQSNGYKQWLDDGQNWVMYENKEVADDKSKGHIIGSKCNTGTITRRPKVFEE